jgi:hypothetical protein
MTRIVVTLLAAAAAALVLAPAAQAVDPLPLSAVSPANGAFRPPTPTGGLAWQFVATGPPADANVAVTVSSSPTTGPDGTLPNDNRLDFFFLSADPSVPNQWEGLSDPGPNAWSADLGVYYWQAVATWTDAAGVFHSAASAVEKLTIGTPPATPPPSPTGGGGAGGGQGPAGAGSRTTLAMSSLDAPFYIRTLIRRRTKRTPTALHYACKRLKTSSFRCRPTWRDSRNVYASTTATLTHVRSGGRVVAHATLTGRRASRTCTRRRSVRSCGVRFTWKATLATRPLGSTSRSARAVR